MTTATEALQTFDAMTAEKRQQLSIAAASEQAARDQAQRILDETTGATARAAQAKLARLVAHYAEHVQPTHAPALAQLHHDRQELEDKFSTLRAIQQDFLMAAKAYDQRIVDTLAGIGADVLAARPFEPGAGFDLQGTLEALSIDDRELHVVAGMLAKEAHIRLRLENVEPSPVGLKSGNLALYANRVADAATAASKDGRRSGWEAAALRAE